MRKTKSFFIIFSSLGILVLYNNCSRMIGLGGHSDESTVIGNPLQVTTGMKVSPYYVNGNNTALSFCLKGITLHSTTDQREVLLQVATSKSILKEGTDLGSLNLPAGVYSQVDMKLNNDCTSSESINIANVYGNFISTDSVTLSFLGNFTISALQAPTLSFDIQNVFNQLETVQSSSELVPKAQSQLGVVEFSTGLLARYTMDETGAVIMDSSGTNNNGTLIGGASTVSPVSVRGRSLSLDGVDDCVNLGSNILRAGSEQLTVSAWVLINDLSIDARVIALSNSINPTDPGYIFSLGIYMGTLRVRLLGQSFDGPSISKDVFHHLAFTYDGSMLKIYINGQEVSSTFLSGRIPASSFDAYIGTNDPLNARFLKGNIDEVRIYSRALNALEIQNLALP